LNSFRKRANRRRAGGVDIAFQSGGVQIVQRIIEHGNGFRQGFVTGGEVTHLSDHRVDIVQVEADEGSHLGLGFEDPRVRVDVERAGQGVGAIFSRFLRGRHAIHREHAQAVRLFLIVGIAEVPDGVFVAFHALHQHIVILGLIQVLGFQGQGLSLIQPFDLVGFLDHNFHKEVKRAAVGARRVAQNRLGGPGRIHV